MFTWLGFVRGLNRFDYSRLQEPVLEIQKHMQTSTFQNNKYLIYAIWGPATKQITKKGMPVEIVSIAP